MLLQFSVANYGSIKNEVQFSITGWSENTGYPI